VMQKFYVNFRTPVGVLSMPWLLGILAFHVAFSPGVAEADEPVSTPSSNRMEAASMLSATLENNEGLRSYDVLIEFRTDRFRPDGMLFVEVETQRFSVDRDAEKWLFVSSRKSEGVPEGSVVSRPDGSVLIQGIGYANGQGWHIPANAIDFPDQSQKNSPQYYLSFVGAPDLRYLGLMSYPAGFLNRVDDMFKEHTAAQTSPGSDVALIESKDHVLVYSDKPYGKSPGQFARKQWVFTNGDLVPSRKQFLICKHKEPGPGHLSRLLQSENYNWIDKNGVFVPERIIGQHATVQRMPDGTSKEYIYDSEVKFTWLRVNEPLEEKHFSRDVWRSESDILEFIAEGQKDIRSK